jgi:hypothetical protein
LRLLRVLLKLDEEGADGLGRGARRAVDSVLKRWLSVKQYLNFLYK